jgi:hypothetical protein
VALRKIVMGFSQKRVLTTSEADLIGGLFEDIGAILAYTDDAKAVAEKLREALRFSIGEANFRQVESRAPTFTKLVGGQGGGMRDEVAEPGIQTMALKKVEAARIYADRARRAKEKGFTIDEQRAIDLVSGRR